MKDKGLIDDTLSTRVSVITVNARLRNVFTCVTFDATLGEGNAIIPAI